MGMKLTKGTKGVMGMKLTKGTKGGDEVNEVLPFPNEWRGLNKYGERVAEEGGDLAG